MKPRLKTQFCIDWLRARQDRDPPASAPVHWGCPRGPRCEYAHGEEELRGKALDEIQQNRKQSKEAEVMTKRDAYLEPIVKEEQQLEAAMHDAVLAGLLKNRKKSINKPSQIGSSSTTSTDTLNKNNDRTVLPDTSSPKPHTSIPTPNQNNPTEESQIRIPETSQHDFPGESTDPSEIATPSPWLEVLAGDVVTDVSGDVRCLSGFGTLTCRKAAVSSGKWYYEVEVVTGGLSQVTYLLAD